MALEKRESVRKNFCREIEMESMTMERGKIGSVLRKARCVDISRGGVGIMTESELRKGEVLKLFMPLEGFDLTLPVYAQVMWASPGDKEFRAGIRFLV